MKPNRKFIALLAAFLFLINQATVIQVAQADLDPSAQVATVNNPTVSVNQVPKAPENESYPVDAFYAGPLSVSDGSVDAEEETEITPEEVEQVQEEQMTDRQSFDYSSSLLIQAKEEKIAVAFTVGDLQADDLETMVSGDYPEALVLAYRDNGEMKYLIYSSGSNDDIRAQSEVSELIEYLQSLGVKAAHSHIEHSYDQATDTDHEQATQEEGLFTTKGAYLFSQGETSGNIGYDGLMKWFGETTINVDEAKVKDAVNRLLAIVDSKTVVNDSFNIFREGNVTTSTEITEVEEQAPSYIPMDQVGVTGGSDSDTTVTAQSRSEVEINYSSLNSGWAGATMSSSSGPINLSAYTSIFFQVKSSESASDLKIEINVDGGATHVYNLAGISPTEKTYQLNISGITNRSAIQSISFVRDSSMTPSGAGTINISLAGGFNEPSSVPASLGVDTTKIEGDVTRLPKGSTTLLTGGSSAGSSVSADTDLSRTLTYSFSSGGYAGVTFEYSVGRNFTKRSIIVLGLKGTAGAARIEIQDTLGRTVSINLTGISSTEVHYYTIDLADPNGVFSYLSPESIKRINIVTDEGLAGNTSGTLEVQLAKITDSTVTSGVLTEQIGRAHV